MSAKNGYIYFTLKVNLISIFRNPEDLINSELSPAKLEDAEQQRPDEVVSIIEAGFNNRKSFSCPKTKVDIVTGTSTANLNPEDIGFIAAMGDSMATGTGLWPRFSLNNMMFLFSKKII